MGIGYLQYNCWDDDVEENIVYAIYNVKKLN